MLINGRGTTVVVADNNSSWACNLAPDTAVSDPGRLDFEPVDLTASDFAIASGQGPDPFYWGGGRVPIGIRSVTFSLPDGGSQAALIESGYWVMQYFPQNPWESEDEDHKITVKLAGVRYVDPYGGFWEEIRSRSRRGVLVEEREFSLEWLRDTCNQRLHGC